MYDSMQFGSILRRAREERREDLLSVARKVRIRPDILEAIENSDFEHMPPRGYARNMINAYARYLGLNPTEVVKLYLDAQYQHQLDAERGQSAPSVFDMSGGDRRAVGPRRSAASSVDITRGLDPVGYDSRRRNFPGQRDVLDSRVDSALTQQMNPVGRRDDQGFNDRGPRKPDSHSSRNPNRYSAPQPGRFGGGKMAIAIAVAVLLIIGIAIAVAMNMSKAPSEDQGEAQQMNITGLPGSENTAVSDTAKDQSTETQEQVTEPEPEPVAPTKTVIEYSVADGESAYIEISVNGSYVFADYADGPTSSSFDVTADSGDLVFVTTNPEAVTLTQDGEPVELSADDSGIVNLTFKFQDVLDAWNAEQEAKAAEKQQSSGSSSSTSSGSGSSSSGR